MPKCHRHWNISNDSFAKLVSDSKAEYPNDNSFFFTQLDVLTLMETTGRGCGELTELLLDVDENMRDEVATINERSR